jgi:ribitol 2-dehydrogenase
MSADYNRLSGKVAAVIGASSGVGLAIARLQGRYGVEIALVARSEDILEDVSEELAESIAVPTNIT